MRQGRFYIKACLSIAVLVLIASYGCGPSVPRLGMEAGPDMGAKVVEGGVRFTVYAPKASRVNVVGDFNNWSTVADPLYDREGNGIWVIVIPLTPGRYEYKFIIDNERWIPDPANPESVDDGFGGLNSVLVVE